MSEQEDVCAQARAAWKWIESAAKQAGAKETSLRLAAIGVLTIVFEGARKRRELEARVDALEKQQKALRYRGVHQRAETYEKNNLVTHDGSLWIALKDDPGKPGEGDGWQLVAKGAR